MTTLSIPEFSLVVLIGATGSGKSTFASKFFKPNEILASAQLRALIADREGALEVAAEAFELLINIAEKRLSRRLLTVIDASNLQPEIRKTLIALAKNWDVAVVAIVFTSEGLLGNNESTKEGQALLSHQLLQQKSALRSIPHEGFKAVYVLNDATLFKDFQVKRVPLNCDRRHIKGPFDIIGDVHGCWEELKELMEKMGYTFECVGDKESAIPPPGRTTLFLGDLIDRGPDPMKCLQCAMIMASKGYALMLPGNHEEKLIRYLIGKKVSGEHGFQETVNQLTEYDPHILKEVELFLKALPYHYLLDEGKLVVAHAGMKERYQGRESGRIRAFALYGDTTGERDELGLPVRSNWALDYWGKALVVYGHTPVRQPLWINRSVNIDTGCVFGGSLTGLHYPEMETISVPSKKVYTPPKRFLEFSEESNAPQESLQFPAESAGIETALMGKVFSHKEGVAGALEEIRASTLDPKSFVYLPLKPPSIGFGETSLKESFHYYATKGIRKLYCRQKVGGIPVTLLLCRNERISKQRFGFEEPLLGVCFNEQLYDPFYRYHLLGAQFFERVCEAITRAGLWERLETSWLIMEGELLPHSLANEDYSERVLSSRLDWVLRGVDSLRFFPSFFAAVENRLLLEEPIQVQEEILALFRHQDPHLLRAPHEIHVDLKESYSKESAQKWWFEAIEACWEGCDVFPLISSSLLVTQNILPFLRCLTEEKRGYPRVGSESSSHFFSQYALTHETLRRILNRSSFQERFNSFFTLKTY